MSTLKYWVWLSSLRGVGPVSIAALLRRYGTPKDVFFANNDEIMHMEGIKRADFTALFDKDLKKADEILASCDTAGCGVLTMQDAQYPDRLRNIYDPPIVLYIRGNMPVIDEIPVVAIVGTRNCTPYGIKSSEDIACTLAKCGLTVATGLARGVDSAAARGALRGGGRVIGVIGSGIDVVYPPENAGLYDDVAHSGAIISEYPPGTKPSPSNFPARNRIISGISLGVAVIEAPKKSGALITASRALEQGRDVFALPANIGAKSSEGSNSLLREGAIPVLSGDDIVGEYADLFRDVITFDSQTQPDALAGNGAGNRSAARRNTAGGADEDKSRGIDNEVTVEYIDVDKYADELEGAEKTVAVAIGREAVMFDDIIAESSLTPPQALSALTMLEIKGYAVKRGDLWSLRENAAKTV